MEMNDELDQQFGSSNESSLGNRWDRPAFRGEFACFVFFVLEMCVRIIISSRLVWSGHPLPWWKWMTFDCLLLSVTAMHFVSQDWPNALILRSFCSLTVLIVFESEKVNSVMNTAVKMLHIFISSLPTLVSTLAFMVLLMYLFAMIISHFVVREMKNGSADEKLKEDVAGYYSSVARTLRSLFAAITGGDDWFNMMDPLDQLSSLTSFLFVIYVGTMVIGVLNILTGYFVEQAMQFSELSRDEKMKAQLQQEAGYTKELREIFLKGDTDGSGSLTWEEFEEHMNDERVNTYLSTLDLDVSELQTLFQILDTDSTGDVDIEDFVWGCLRLKGGAKSIDLCTLLFEHRQHMDQIIRSLRGVEQHLNWQDETLITNRPDDDSLC